MEDEHPLGGVGADPMAFVSEHPREPEGFPRSFLIVDVDVASSRVHQHEPRDPRPDDEPDDEQPPIELGVHRRDV